MTIQYYACLPCGAKTHTYLQGISDITGCGFLNEAIKIFQNAPESQVYKTEDGAEGMCNHASDEFLHILEIMGYMDAEIEHYDPVIYLDGMDYPYGLKGCKYHWAIRVGELVIDWTARQFNPEAPFPAIWRADRQEWRNVPRGTVALQPRKEQGGPVMLVHCYPEDR